MLTPETTNANAEAQQMLGGRIKNWAKENKQFLTGAGIGSGARIAGAIAGAAFAATTLPTDGIDPKILDHVHD